MYIVINARNILKLELKPLLFAVEEDIADCSQKYVKSGICNLFYVPKLPATFLLNLIKYSTISFLQTYNKSSSNCTDMSCILTICNSFTVITILIIIIIVH